MAIHYLPLHLCKTIAEVYATGHWISNTTQGSPVYHVNGGPDDAPWINIPAGGSLISQNASISYIVPVAGGLTNLTYILKVRQNNIVAGTKIMRLFSQGGVEIAQLRQNAAGGIDLYTIDTSNNATYRGTTAPGIMGTGNWREAKIEVIGHLTNGSIRFFVDCIEVLAVTGIPTLLSTAPSHGILAMGDRGAYNGGSIDIALVLCHDDTEPRLGRIVRATIHQASADVAGGDGVVTGAASSSAAWADASDATYVTLPATVGAKQLVEIADPVATFGEILGVIPTVRAKKTDTTSSVVKLRISDPVGSADGAAITPPSSGYGVYGSLLRRRSDGATWITNDILAIQAGAVIQ